MAALGGLLRSIRCGPDKLAGNDARIAAPTTIVVTSPEFATATTMPSRYRGVRGIFPPIAWSNVPESARELVLIVEDVDVPLPAPIVHAIAYGISIERPSFEAGAIPNVGRGTRDYVEGAWLGLAAGFFVGYVPPTPLPGHGAHRYVFEIFALEGSMRRFERPPTRARLLEEMAGHVRARGAIVGLAEA